MTPSEVRQPRGSWCRLVTMHMVLVGCSVILGMEPSEAWAVERLSHLQRAKVFLQAGDYRQALEACQAEVRDRPSARSYVYLTYVYHAVNGYLEQLAATDQWVRVEHLYLNLATGRPEDLVDPPDVLARIAKELIQQAVQRQSDVTAAMAARLDEAVVQRLWEEQTAWRKARAADWWAGVPLEWHWERP
ncbi:MAG: hypothetical protein NBKEAIPA_02250 [Nitrospirae bacterium]|nr:MAG: hypothetical protein UZ03_NOB001003247 [Nitrospira sp. OLB3]MBV6470335.1 hypothetical protein [Nitrospirota bacterium]